MYILERRQRIHAPIGKVWDLLKSPKNLNTITPENLRFEIVSNIPDEMYNGLTVEYRISIPLFGRRKWLAEIKHIREGRSFVDEQRIGPYAFWYHYHELEKIEDGVLMTDRVHYKVPFGFFGKVLHYFFIRKMLDHIFEYRHLKLTEIFEGEG